MAQRYASTQPKGFKNRVENVAIVGAGGQVGKYIVEALLETGAHKITAITRASSTNTIPSAGITIAKVDYDDQDTLVQALQGQQVLIITMAVGVPAEQQTKLIEAAATANVPFVLPNEWGPDGMNEELGRDTFLWDKATKHRAEIEKLGKSSWIGVSCSFWYEYSLSFGPEAYGFDFKNRSVTFIDDGTTRINTSTWPQCGRGIVGLLGLKILPDDEEDESPCLSQFSNRFVYMSSFLVSQKDMLDSVLRVTGTTAEDWKINKEPSQARYKRGMAELQKGNRSGFATLLYSRVFYPNGDGDFETSKGLQNEVLGLPKEEIDESTKVALKMAEEKSQ